MFPATTDLRRTAGATSDEKDDHHDREALWSVWEEYHPRLCRTVAQRTGRPVSDHDVQDAATDALLRFHRANTDERHIDEVSGWLMTVAWREFLRRNGRDGRRRQVERTMFARAERVVPIRGPEDVALERAGRSAQRRAIDLGLRMLSEGQRESLALWAEGATYEEIAVARATTVRAVDRAMRGARRQLRMNGLLAREAREWAR